MARAADLAEEQELVQLLEQAGGRLVDGGDLHTRQHLLSSEQYLGKLRSPMIPCGLQSKAGYKILPLAEWIHVDSSAGASGVAGLIRTEGLSKARWYLAKNAVTGQQGTHRDARTRSARIQCAASYCQQLSVT